MKIKVSNVNTPNWKEVTVKSRIPEELEKLSEIARNIWWAWNFEATELFRDLDPELWKECGQNPVLLLERMSYEKLEALAKDKVILRRMNEVYTKFRDYMDVKFQILQDSCPVCSHHGRSRYSECADSHVPHGLGIALALDQCCVSDIPYGFYLP